MNYAQARRSYQKIAAETASPAQLVLMLFDGAIDFLEKALAGFAHDDPLEFNRTINNNILRAQGIVQELNVVLDMDGGGELSRHLRRLYDYCDWRLQDANLKKHPDSIRDVLRRLTVLRDSWAEMLRQRTHEVSTAAAAPPMGS
jgi:flagellar protein FliS